MIKVLFLNKIYVVMMTKTQILWMKIQTQSSTERKGLATINSIEVKIKINAIAL